VSRPDVDGEGVADQAVDPAELIATARQHLGPGVRGGHVADHGEGSRCLLARLDVHLDHGCALVQQPLHAGGADAGGGTTHHDDAISQAHRPSLSSTL
jgi:hypothetical protein